jgi:hypothetical protein
VRRALAALVLLAVLAAGFAAAAFFVPDRRPVDEPEPKKHEFARRVLIGELGPPAEGRFLAGDRQAIVVNEPGELFSVETKTCVLWQLLDKAPSPRFSLEGEVRLDDSKDGEAGLFVGHHEIVPHHFFWKVGFFENGRAPGAVAMALRKFTPPLGISSAPLAMPQTSFHASAQTNKAPEFHAIKLDVHDEWIDAFWDGRHFGKVERSKFDQARAGGDLAIPPSDFCPQGPIGFYVNIGKASVRRCVLIWEE